jgi:DNA-binding CsgD family transcriptional regulator
VQDRLAFTADSCGKAAVVRRAAESPDERFRSFSSKLNNSTVGIAVYDKRMQCRALNAALASVNGVPVSAQIGKTIQQLYGKEGSKLELALRRVWATGYPLPDFPWDVRFSMGRGPTRWLVNFYPIGDNDGKIKLVAATFSEVTKRSSLESRLSRLAAKFTPGDAGGADLFGEEFAQMSARTTELVQRSVNLLKTSHSLRCFVSETRIETLFVRMALCFSGKRDHEHAAIGEEQKAKADAEPPSNQGPSTETELPAGCPSPRERQVLHLLADGKSNKEIGSALDLSTRTVETYRARIMLKLDLHSTAALVRYAVRNHIVEA